MIPAGKVGFSVLGKVSPILRDAVQAAKMKKPVLLSFPFKIPSDPQIHSASCNTADALIENSWGAIRSDGPPVRGNLGAVWEQTISCFCNRMILDEFRYGAGRGWRGFSAGRKLQEVMAVQVAKLAQQLEEEIVAVAEGPKGESDRVRPPPDRLTGLNPIRNLAVLDPRAVRGPRRPQHRSFI